MHHQESGAIKTAAPMVSCKILVPGRANMRSQRSHIAGGVSSGSNFTIAVNVKIDEKNKDVS